MKVLSVEKAKRLAHRFGWSLAYSQGFLRGTTSRRLGEAPALHTLVGIDESSLGFRAGYFDRQNHQPRAVRNEAAARQPTQFRPGRA